MVLPGKAAIALAYLFQFLTRQRQRQELIEVLGYCLVHHFLEVHYRNLRIKLTW